MSVWHIFSPKYHSLKIKYNPKIEKSLGMRVSNNFEDTEICQVLKMIDGHSNQNLTAAPSH